MAALKKGKQSRFALLRIAILLTIIMTVSVAWEHRQSQSLNSVSGTVVNVEKVASGRGGDNSEFRIEYFVYGEKYFLVTRRGIFDSFGEFCCLTVGDSVPVAVDSRDPMRAILDSRSARYPYTLSFGLLSLVFLIAMLVVAIRTHRK